MGVLPLDPYDDPEIVLDALTKQQSTFTHQDLARFIGRHTASTEQFHKVYERLQVADELVRLGKDAQGQERLTTREMLFVEASMLKNAQLLSERGQGNIDEQILAGALAKRHLSEEQATALRYITEDGDLKCVLGYAGTGKSYMLAAAREVWEDAGYRVRGVALSGIATQNLQQSSGIESRTNASLLYGWDKGKNELTAQDVLVIDEAGMLGSRQMERIMNEAQDKGAKVVIVGDWQQLQAIEAGAAFRAIAEEHHYIELQEVRRQESTWQREATVLLAKGQVGAALAKYQGHDQLHSFETQREAKERLIEQWNDVRHTHPQESQLIMAYTRKDVKELNELARQLKQEDGELGQSQSFNTSGGLKEFATGDRIYFLKRDDSMGVINGTLGTITAIESKAGQIQVELDQDQLSSKQRQVIVDTSQYKHLDHGYAATVHKAQGTTVDRSYLLTSSHYDAHSTYVGMSRHREGCDIFSSREQFKDKKELFNTLSRNRTKDVTLDYTKPWLEYTRQREIQPDPRLDSLLSLHNRFEQHAPFYENQAKLFLDIKRQEERQQFWQEADKFMSKFEQAHQEVAKRIRDNLIAEHEKQAIEYIKQFKAYSHNLSRLKSKDLQDFTKLTREIVSSPAVMNHISVHDRELAMQIKETFKQHEIERSMSYERSLSLGNGLSL